MNIEFPKEKVLEAYGNAPQEVRDTFNAEATTASIANFQNKYRLHIDAVANLGKEVGYMLLGLLSPQEFFEALQKNGCDQATARQIMDDLNREIFIPLHEKMTGNTNVPSVTSVRAPSYAQEPAPAISQFDLTTPVPTPAYVPTPITPAQPAPAAPEFQPVVSQAAPISTPPVMTPPAAPISTPPAPKPIAPAPVVPPMPQPEQPTAPSEASVDAATREALGNAMKQYGIDPYREPIDVTNS